MIQQLTDAWWQACIPPSEDGGDWPAGYASTAGARVADVHSRQQLTFTAYMQRMLGQACCAKCMRHTPLMHGMHTHPQANPTRAPAEQEECRQPQHAPQQPTALPAEHGPAGCRLRQEVERQ